MSDEVWPRIQLGDLLTDIQPGFASGIHNQTGDGIPHFRPMNVTVEGRVDRVVLKFVDPSAGKPSLRLAAGDIVFNNTNSPELVGKTALFEDADSPAFSNHMTRLRVDARRLDSAYAALRLHQAWREGWFAAHCNNHVSQASISREVLRAFEIELPDLPVQRAVAALAQSIDSKRASSSKHLSAAGESVERFRQAVLSAACSGRLTADWRATQVRDALDGSELADSARIERRRESSRFVEPQLNDHAEKVDLPEFWTEVALGLLLTDIKYGTSQRSQYDSPGVPVLRIPNVSGERLSVADLKFAVLSDAEAASLQLREADLLMIRSNGSPQLVGKTVVISGRAIGMTYAGYLMRLRVDRVVAVPAFLAIALRAPHLRHQVEMPLRSTSGVHNINTQEVRGLAVPLPPLAEQAEIVQRVDRLMDLADAVADRLNAAATRVDRSSQAVLARAFRGELIS